MSKANFSRESYCLGSFSVDTLAVQTLQGTNNYSLVWTTCPIHINLSVSSHYLRCQTSSLKPVAQSSKGEHFIIEKALNKNVFSEYTALCINLVYYVE